MGNVPEIEKHTIHPAAVEMRKLRSECDRLAAELAEVKEENLVLKDRHNKLFAAGFAACREKGCQELRNAHEYVAARVLLSIQPDRPAATEGEQ